MSIYVVCCEHLDDLETAAGKMESLDIGAIPVVDNGQLTGMISLGDLSIREQANESAGSALSDISKSF
nr:CBS domain-containing protein [Bacillus xiapuensis]